MNPKGKIDLSAMMGGIKAPEAVMKKSASDSFQNLLTNFSKPGGAGLANNPFKLALLKKMNSSKTSLQEMF